MTVSLSIKNVPEELAEKLRERAKRNHRSLQGELLAILEESMEKRVLTPDEVLREVRALGIETPDEATAIIREDRDTDHGRLPREAGDAGYSEWQKPAPKLTVEEAHEWVKTRGLKTKSNSSQIIREERDAR